jgi:uncharacterized protein YqjF (DUF2071 family)
MVIDAAAPRVHPDAPHRVRWPVSLQSWQTLTFLHWAYDADVVQRLVPEPLRVHVFDGHAWVGVTPFQMDRARLPLAPPVRPLSRFPETNVRTYVVAPDGTEGLWFLTLEAESLPVVVAGRAAAGVPYRWATMNVISDGRVCYRSRRRGPGEPGVGHDIVVTPQAPILRGDVTELDHFLTARWRAFSVHGGRLLSVPVEHQRWPLWRATADRVEQDLLTACGLPAPAGDPLVHWSPGVDVRLGAPRPVRW